MVVCTKRRIPPDRPAVFVTTGVLPSSSLRLSFSQTPSLLARSLSLPIRIFYTPTKKERKKQTQRPPPHQHTLHTTPHQPTKMKASLTLNMLLASGAVATWGTGGGGSSSSGDCCCEEGSSSGWKRTDDHDSCEDSSGSKRTFGWGTGGGGSGSGETCTCSETTTTEGSGWTFPTISMSASTGYTITWGWEGGGGGSGGGSGGGDMTTSTIYATSVHTVTSCAPDVTDCPGETYTTVTVAVSTTICPVTSTEAAGTTPVETGAPPPTSAASSVAATTPPTGATTTTQDTTLVTSLPSTTRATVTGGGVGSNGTTTSRPTVVTAAAAPNAQVGGGLAFAAFVAAML